MARTETGWRLTEQHRGRQIGLRAATVQDLNRLLPVWDPGDARSFDRFASATTTLVRSRRRESAGLAGSYYEAFRTAEDVGGQPTLRLAEDADPTVVRRSLRVTGEGQVAASMRAGHSPQAARMNAHVALAGSISRHVLNGGRETLIGSAQADRQARGWQRVTSGDPCAFCVMLSSRGPVFKQDTADFQPHDHCACTPEPVYRGGEWNRQNSAHRGQWEAAQRQARDAGELQRGTSNDALNALRRYIS